MCQVAVVLRWLFTVCWARIPVLHLRFEAALRRNSTVFYAIVNDWDSCCTTSHLSLHTALTQKCCTGKDHGSAGHSVSADKYHSVVALQRFVESETLGSFRHFEKLVELGLIQKVDPIGTADEQCHYNQQTPSCSD
jgi:hypothetical protein